MCIRDSNDMGHFRLELELKEDGSMADVEEYCLEVELMFSDLISQGGPEKFQSSSSLKEIDPTTEFKSVSQRLYNLRKISDGIFEYTPVVFEEQHYCVSLCTVHSSLLNLQYRTKALRLYSRELQSKQAVEKPEASQG